MQISCEDKAHSVIQIGSKGNTVKLRIQLDGYVDASKENHIMIMAEGINILNARI